MPRPIIDEPLSRGATWTRRFAGLGAALALAAIVLSHHGTVGPRHALAILAAGFAAAIVSVPCGFLAAASIWRRGHRGIGRVLVGLALSAGTLAYPSALALRAYREPPVFDASTDGDDPPRLSTSPHALAIRGDVDRDRASVGHGDTQANGLQPVVLDGGAGEAFTEVLSVLKLLRWHVVESVPPVRSGLGHIDAVTYSTVMHLPQDVAIRIRPMAGQTRVDIRSVSRLHVPDVNDDTRNVETFVQVLRDQDDGT